MPCILVFLSFFAFFLLQPFPVSSAGNAQCSYVVRPRTLSVLSLPRADWPVRTTDLASSGRALPAPPGSCMSGGLHLSTTIFWKLYLNSSMSSTIDKAAFNMFLPLRTVFYFPCIPYLQHFCYMKNACGITCTISKLETKLVVLKYRAHDSYACEVSAAHRARRHAAVPWEDPFLTHELQ